MKRRTTCVALLVLSASILAGCSSTATTVATPSPSPTRSASTPSPSATPEPTKTPTGSPTAPAKPSPSPTAKPAPQPSQKPQPKPEPVKTVVVEIGADELRIEDISGGLKNSFPYEGDSADEAIAALTSLYGKEPKTLYTGDDICNYQNNVYSWDNMNLSFQAASQSVADAERFLVFTNSANQNYERVVQAPNGAQVGLSLKRFHAASPGLAYSPGIDYEGVSYGSMIGEPSKITVQSASNSGDPALLPADANAVGTVIFATNDTIKSIHAPGSLVGDC